MDLNQAVRNMNQASFNSFEGGSDNYEPDPTESFDPAFPNQYVGRGAGTTKRQATGGRNTQGSFQITVTNTNTNPVNFELFNYMRSLERIENASRYGSLVPASSSETIVADVNGGTNNVQNYGYFHKSAVVSGSVSGYPQDICAWQKDGSLIHNYNVGSNGNLVIQCAELPYRSLLEYTSTGALSIASLRLEVSDETQINRTLIWSKKNIFGVEVSNNLSISRNKSAYQFQPKIVEVNMPFVITAETALLYSIGGSQNLTLTFYVNSFTRPNV
jgi:hypothetical protein